MFYDLALGEDKDDAFLARDRMAMAVRLGYDCVAVVHRNLAHSFRPDFQPEARTISPDQFAQGGPGTAAALRAHQGLVRADVPARSLKQLTRLTLVTDDNNPGQTVLGPACQARHNFDLLAVQPLSAKALKQACAVLDVDIIAMDLSQRLPFKMSLVDLKAAMNRGIHFEICYSPALRNDKSRRLLFANAQSLTRATRGRHVIVSSEARQALELRGPYDVINLATLLGLSEGDGKRAISERCSAVLKHAEQCRAFRGAIQIVLQPASEAREQGAKVQGAEEQGGANAATAEAASSQQGRKRKKRARGG